MLFSFYYILFFISSLFSCYLFKHKKYSLPHNYISQSNISRLLSSSFNYSNDEVQALCDLLLSTNVASIKPSWYCQNSTTIIDVCNFNGVGCSSNYEIITLTLGASNGTIPSTIGFLKNLSFLSLSFSSLTGTIPSSIGYLTNLETLYLSVNSLQGTIPSSFGYLHKLTIFYLYLNQLTGTIPSSIGLLENLRILDFSSNQIEGSLPTTFGYLTNLYSLSIYKSYINGIFPSFIGSLVNLKTLNLSRNRISGTISSSICFATLLETIILNTNQITGTIPSSIILLTNLKQLQLSLNQLTGSFPTILGFLPKLNTLGISYNYLSGTIPYSLTQLINLRSLDLSTNRFTGTLPSFLNVLTNLQTLSLRYCSFTGTIPENLMELTNLQSLALNDNKLTGFIPSTFGLLIQLTTLSLVGNYFIGEIPSSLGLLTNLRSLFLKSNQLTGTIPSSLSILNKIFSFDFSRNYLIGSIPSEFSKLKTITILSLSYNSLEEIPAILCNLSTNLRYIDLRYNSFICIPLCFSTDIPTTKDSNLRYCPDEQDKIMCNLGDILQINSILPNDIEIYGSATSIESSHPILTDITFTQTVTFNFVYAIEVSFHPFSQYQLNYTITLCANSECIYLDQIAIIYQNTAIRFYSPSVQITVKAIAGTYWGYLIYITPIYLHTSWSCSTNNLNIISAHSVCNWIGVTCLNNGYITNISIPTLQLKGNIETIIPLFQNLSYLGTIDLSYNSLTGTLPKTLWTDLKSLIKVDISNNQISGQIPVYYDNFFSSTQNISNNDDYNQRNLKLILSSNNLKGKISESLLNIPWLFSLEVDGNSLSGKFSELFCDNTTNIDSNNNKNITEITWKFANNPKLCYSECWTATHPLDISQKVYCSNKQDSNNLMLILLISGSILIFLLILIFISFRYFQPKVSPEQLEKLRRLDELPIHKAILDHSPIDILSNLLKDNNILQTSKERDYDGNTVIDIIIEATTIPKNITVDILYCLMENSLFLDPKTGNEITDASYHTYAWPKLVQSSEPICVEVVKRILLENKKYIERFAQTKDSHSRESLAIATPICREIIEHYLFLWSRFELFHGPPEHISDTCIVKFAYDRSKIQSTKLFTSGLSQIDGIKLAKKKIQLKDKDLNKINNFQNQKVALKFMNDISGFYNEIKTYENGSFDDDYVISFLYFIDTDENNELKEDLKLKGLGDYPYCIVMEAGETNLFREVLQQHFVGRDWEKIRWIFTSLVHCVQNIHESGYIHGDLKPMNVLMTSKGNSKLIDFDASCNLNNEQYVGNKFSSSYLPPEMFIEINGDIIVRSYEKNYLTGKPHNNQNLSYSLVPASVSHDMWSLGIILFYLCTGSTLFSSTIDDHIFDKKDLILLYNWTNETLIEKLDRIKNRYARNLVSMLLNYNPLYRPDCNRVLLHPFVTGKEARRLPGELFEWDIFISYRVASDSIHAKLLYEALISTGLKVWWDVMCLSPGENWEKEFCQNLMSSDCLICLLSREAINSKTDKSRNINNLTSYSSCDNVLLEWRIGLELKQRGMISKIYPILIGDKIDSNNWNKEIEYSNYFSSGCHPQDLQEIVVESIENKLYEHLNNEGLGLPYQKSMNIKSLVSSIISNQGGFIKGERNEAIENIVKIIVSMCSNNLKA